MLALPKASDKAPISSGIRGKVPGGIGWTIDLAIGLTQHSTARLCALLRKGKKYLVVDLLFHDGVCPHFCRLGDPSKFNYCQNALTRSTSRTPNLNMPFGGTYDIRTSPLSCCASPDSAVCHPCTLDLLSRGSDDNHGVRPGDRKASSSNDFGSQLGGSIVWIILAVASGIAAWYLAKNRVAWPESIKAQLRQFKLAPPAANPNSTHP